MNHSPADILRHFMVQAGVCTLPSANGVWPGHANTIVDGEADNLVLFSDTNGSKDGRIMRTGETVEHPGIQILVRSIGQQVGWQKSQSISVMIDAINRQRVIIQGNTYLLQSVARRGSVIMLSMEEHFKALERQEKELKKKRMMFVINCAVTIQNPIVSVLLPPSPDLAPDNSYWISQTPSGAIDGSNTVFTITPVTAPYLLYLDNVLQTAYTLSGTTITFAAAPVGTVLTLISTGD